MCRETVVYCRLRLHYCYRATVIRSNKYVSLNIIKEKLRRARRRYSHLRQRTTCMADDSNEEETGSQQVRQSTRNEGSNGSYKKGAYRGNRNNMNMMQGNIAENNVYQYGTRDQGDRFTRTTEAIANYVGRLYST
jgi:hypothetical protein